MKPYKNLPFFVAVILFWLAISGFFKPLFIFFGIISSLLTVWFSLRLQKILEEDIIERNKLENKNISSLLHPKFFAYCFWLCKEIFLSTISLAKEMWKVKPAVSPVAEWIKSDINNELGISIYANSITMTPGTICMFAKKDRLLVHAINENYMEGLKQNIMHDKVKGLG